MAEDGPQHPHLGSSQHPDLERSWKFDDRPAGQIEPAEQFGHAEKSGLADLELEDCAAPIHPEAGGISVKLVMQHQPIEGRQRSRQRQPPGRDVEDVAFGMIGRSGHQIYPSDQPRDHLSQHVRIVGTITIDRAHYFIAGMLQSGENATGYSHIMTMPDQVAILPRTELPANGAHGVIGTGIVNQDKLHVISSGQFSLDAAEGVGQVGQDEFLVVAGHHDGH